MNKRLLSNSPGPLWFPFFFFQTCSQSINNLISQIPMHPWNKSFFPSLSISRDCWFSPAQSSTPVKSSFLTSLYPILQKAASQNYPQIFSGDAPSPSHQRLVLDGKHSTIKNFSPHCGEKRHEKFKHQSWCIPQWSFQKDPKRSACHNFN